MSLSLAGGGAGKNASLSVAHFSSVVSALLSRVGMKEGVWVLSMYFLICHMDFPSALLTYSLHLASFSFAIALVYSLSFCLHFILSRLFLVLLCLFLARFAARRSCERCGVHHRLL